MTRKIFAGENFGKLKTERNKSPVVPIGAAGVKKFLIRFDKIYVKNFAIFRKKFVKKFRQKISPFHVKDFAIFRPIFHG